MKLRDRLKDFFSNFKNKLLLAVFLVSLLWLNFTLVSERQQAAIEIIKSIDLSQIFLAVIFPIFCAMCSLYLIHEFLKLFKIEINDKDISISSIISVILAIGLIIRNLLTVLTESQFNLIITLFGLPGFVFLPKLFGYLISFSEPEPTEDHGDKNKHELNDAPHDKKSF